MPTATVSPSVAQNLCAGTSATLFANTGANLAYQWKLNNADISGQTNATITSNLGGNYTVEVTNTTTGCKNTSTPPVAFILKPIPVAIATPLTGTSFCQGNSTVISATSTYGNTYQWFRNGNAITGATAATYSATQAGSYTVLIQRDGCTNISNAIVTSVLPYINPVAVAVGNTQICNGDTVTIFTQSGTGFTYQWLRNGLTIAGATNSILKATTSGNYAVVVSYNGLCSQTSNLISVTVTPPINTNLANPYPGPIVRFCPNTINKLEVQLQAPNVTYQWFYNGYILPGVIGPSLNITQAGSYYVKLTNIFGCTANSIIANVSYHVPANPIITQNGLILGTSSFTSYQWYFNGSPLAGATAATHEVYQSGSYSLVAINTNGCVAFSDTLLAIYCSPWIQPVIQENNSLLTVSNIPQDAQINWFLDGQLLANQNANYLQLTQNGNYQCQITDAFGCQYESGILLIDASVLETKPEAPLLFPNPNNGLFQIQVPTSWLESKCTVSNLSGQIIWEGVLSKELNQLDLQELVNGTYLLELEKNQIKIHYRLIKTS